jgi:hypothetical protein
MSRRMRSCGPASVVSARHRIGRTHVMGILAGGGLQQRAAGRFSLHPRTTPELILRAARGNPHHPDRKEIPPQSASPASRPAGTCQRPPPAGTSVVSPPAPSVVRVACIARGKRARRGVGIGRFSASTRRRPHARRAVVQLQTRRVRERLPEARQRRAGRPTAANHCSTCSHRRTRPITQHLLAGFRSHAAGVVSAVLSWVTAASPSGRRRRKAEDLISCLPRRQSRSPGWAPGKSAL